MNAPLASIHAAACALLILAAPAARSEVPAPAGSPPAVTAWEIHETAAGLDLFRTDLLTGAAERIGSLGLPEARSGGLALHPSGTLFAIDRRLGRLLTVNRVTGSAQVVGDLGVDFMFTRGFTADACGRLWVITQPVTGGGSTLHEISPTSGAAAPGVPVADGVYGLAAQSESLVAMVPGSGLEQQKLVRIDSTTGQATDLLVLDSPAVFLPVDLDFAPDGDLWGSGVVDFPIDPLPPGSFRIDPHGEVTPVLNFTLHFSFAITPPPGACGGAPVPIPVVSPGGLLALALLLAAAGAALCRAGRAAPDVLT